MSWLKKVGQLIAKGASVAPYIGPIIKAYTPDRVDRLIDAGTNELVLLREAAVNVEAFAATLSDKSLTGQDKMRALIPQAGRIFADGALVAAHGGPSKIKQPDLYAKAMQGFAQATVDLHNSFEVAEN